MATKFPPIGLSAVIENLDGFQNSANQINQSYSSMDIGANTVAATSLKLGGVMAGLAATLATTVVAAAAAAAAAIAGMVAGLIALAKAAINVGTEYTKEMSNVKALTGATAEEFEQLEKSAEELGATTAFTAAQAAEGMGFLAMAGFETNEIISAMPGVLDLAAAGNLDLATSADIVSNILTGMGESSDQTSRFVDVLTATMTSSNTSLVQLGEGMKFVAPLASSLGIDVESVSAAMGTLADAGIQSTMGGTSLRSMLLSLSAPTSKAEKLIKELGISVFDAEGNMRDLPELIGELDGAMKGMNDEAKVQTLNTIFGKRNVAAVTVLLDKGQAELQAFGDTLRNSTGKAAEIAGTQLDNLSGDVTLLSSAFDGIKIEIFKVLEPLLRSIVKIGQQLLEAYGPVLVNTYKNLTDILTPLVDTIGNGMVSALNEFMRGFSQGEGIIDKFTMGFAELLDNFIMEDVLWDFIDAVGNLFSTIFGGVGSFDKFEFSLSGVMDVIIGLVETVLPKLTNMINFVSANWNKWMGVIKSSIGLIVEFGKSGLQFIIDNLPTLIQWLKDGAKIVEEFGKDGIKFVSENFDDFSKAFQVGLKEVKKFVKQLAKTFLPLIMRIVKIFQKDMPENAKTVRKTFNTIMKAIQPLLKKILPDLIDIFDQIKKWTIKNWPLIQDTIVTVIQFISTVIKNNLKSTLKFWEEWGDDIVKITIVIWDLLVSTIKIAIAVIGSIIEVAMKIITGDWEGALNKIKSITVAIFNFIKTAIKNILNSIVSTIASKLRDMVNNFVNKLNELRNSVINIWNNIKSIVLGIVTNMISSIISKIGGSVGSIASALFNALSSAISNVANTVSSIGALGTIAWKIISAIKDKIAGLWGSIRLGIFNAISAAAAALNIVGSTLTKLQEVGWKIIKAIKDRIAGLWGSIRTGISTAISNAANSFSISTVWTALTNIGKDIIKGIISGINSAKNELKNMLSGVMDLIPGWLKDFIQSGSPAKITMPIGADLMGGIQAGFLDGIPSLQNSLSAITSAPPTTASSIAGATGNNTTINNTFNTGNNTLSSEFDAQVFEARVINVIRSNF